MRRVLACTVAVLLVLGVMAPAAHAGGGAAVGIALGLASFAVFNQLVTGLAYAAAPPVYVAPAPVYYAQPAYSSPPVYYARPAYTYGSPVYASTAPIYVERRVSARTYTPPPRRTYPTVVEYPHGRYELRGDGETAPYRWVWIPNPPVAPPAPPAPAR